MLSKTCLVYGKLLREIWSISSKSDHKSSSWTFGEPYFMGKAHKASCTVRKQSEYVLKKPLIPGLLSWDFTKIQLAHA